MADETENAQPLKVCVVFDMEGHVFPGKKKGAYTFRLYRRNKLVSAGSEYDGLSMCISAMQYHASRASLGNLSEST